MSKWLAVDSLNRGIASIAEKLGIIDRRGLVTPDPDEIDEDYLAGISTTVRAFLVLCSSELEEFIESACMAFVGECAVGDDGMKQHNCFHALSIFFRVNLARSIEKEGLYIDFYATPSQARRFAKDRKRSRSAEAKDADLLNRKTLIAHLSGFYSDIVAQNHGISDQKLINLLIPLGFSEDLVRDECPTLCSALQSLAAARGEAAHRSARRGGWPFSDFPKPLQQQLSIGDAWRRWEAVRDSLEEFDALIYRKSEVAA